MMSKKSTVPTNRESDKFVLRLPEGMRGKIAELAKASGRSMNAELVHRIQRTIDEDTELAESGVKIIEGMKIIEGLNLGRSALSLPPGTVLTPHEIDKDDPRYTPYVRREEIQEVLDYIRQEMKNKKS
ncbi:Arc family DNA-binding protein [Aeromonas caviae]|uniref:Arc family DNA-binding protein n=1 Tax=Aeromonas caviae TaxID=648 RepID=UPI00191DFCD3|nr:Arc family DNA-binding protein [Aeromonas caviae]MBL0585087.1 Arc family DNA-binding protein [Aeromonas caviae]